MYLSQLSTCILSKVSLILLLDLGSVPCILNKLILYLINKLDNVPTQTVITYGLQYVPFVLMPNVTLFTSLYLFFSFCLSFSLQIYIFCQSFLFPGFFSLHIKSTIKPLQLKQQLYISTHGHASASFTFPNFLHAYLT